MSLEELANFVRDMKLPELSPPNVDLAKTLGNGALSHVVTTTSASTSTSQPTQTKDPFSEPTLSTLCKLCQSIFKESSPHRPGQVQHHGVDALRARAGRGCQLCLTVHMSLDPVQLMKFQQKVPDSQGIASFTPISRDQARLQFRYLSATASDKEADSPTAVDEKQRSISVKSIKPDPENLRVLSVDMILVKPECTLP